MSKDTGGPAFPREDYQANGHERGFEKLGQEGMTLRDYFAGKAMQSIYSRAGGSPAIDAESCDYFAFHAYVMADAMLKVRSE